MSDAFEDHVHELLRSETTVCMDSCEALLREWVHTCDRSAGVDERGFNDAHVCGMGLAVVCHQATQHEQFCLHDELQNIGDKVLVPEKPMQQLCWTDVANVITALQIEFHTLFAVHENRCYLAHVDIITILIICMARVGYLLTHRWRPLEAGDENMSVEDIENVVDIDAQGWREVATPSIVQIMDGIHALFAGTVMVVGAKPLPRAYQIDALASYHREASLDDFYDMSQIVDTPWGAVSQYKHKFQHLFHSTSQVVYFHFPNYLRRKQIPLQELNRADADNVNVLPLLMQVHPDIKVTFEHTGLALRSHHAASRWQWVVVGAFVFLTDERLQVWFGDVRELAAFACDENRDRDGECEDASTDT